jgi:parallel beta-helix repeat protein
MNKKIYQIMSVIVAFALTFGSFSSAGAAPQMAVTTYNVSATGNDANAGTSAAPFKTIQKCLAIVTAGSTCLVKAGTYNESLTLKTSGTSATPITLKCESAKACTVNSGTNLNLVTGGRIHYYVIDGFRFISTSTSLYTLDFGANIAQPEATPNAGNDHFIFRNNYVEGTIRFFGANNLVEQNELNGKSFFSNGITDKWVSSHDNNYRINTIHDYKVRGVWLQRSSDNVIEGNNIYNIGASGAAIDCDGADSNEKHCYVRNNIIHDFPNAVGILYENCFDCKAEGNIISNGQQGISSINYGLDYVNDGVEYRTHDTHSIFTNNIISNMTYDGIICYSSPGGTAINNTIYKANMGRSYFGAIGLSQTGNYYCHNWTIKNNIISQPNTYALLFESGASGISNVVSDNNFYDMSTTVKKFDLKKGGSDVSHTFTQWLAFYDAHSMTGNSLFVNAAAGDFHLQPNSPACGVGAIPCSGTAPTLAVTNTPIVITATVTVTPVLATITVVPTSSSIPSSTTPTASVVPASPTPTASSIPPLATATKVVIPASPTPTASSIPPSATATTMVIPASPTPTASSIPVLPTSTSAAPIATAQPQSQPASGAVYDDKNSSFMYSSGWYDVLSLDRAYGGSYKQTIRNGSFVTLTFTGKSFSVIYKGGKKFRDINVYVDDVLVGTINEKESTNVFQKRWNYPGQLTSGSHTLKLVFVGTANTSGSVDAVIVNK